MKQENIERLFKAGKKYNNCKREDLDKYNYCVFIANEDFNSEEHLKLINKEIHYFVVFCNNKKEIEIIKKIARTDKSLKDHVIASYDLIKDDIIVNTNDNEYTLKRVEELKIYGF